MPQSVAIAVIQEYLHLLTTGHVKGLGRKYRIEKWSGWCPHWIVRGYGEGGFIGFMSFYSALEHVRWAVRTAERKEEDK